MILVTHGIIGAAAGSFFSFNPWLAFAAGFLSHYVADAIPHWHYSLRSLTYNKNSMQRDFIVRKETLSDILKLGLDFGAGMLLPVAFFWSLLPFSLNIILIAAFAGMLPDALQFVYMKIRREPFATFQRFQDVTHSRTRLDNRPVLGISSQILIALLTVFITYWFLGA